MNEKKKSVVAVINSTADIVDILELCLQDEGFNTTGGLIPEFKRGQRNMLTFMEEHNPDLIIWDIAPPYEQNVIFLEMIQNLKVMEGRKWVYTTTNISALRQFSEKFKALEIIGKPMDLQVIIEAVKKQLD